MEKRIDIVEGDIKDAAKLFGASSFDVITANPPYMGLLAGMKRKRLQGMKYFVRSMMY